MMRHIISFLIFMCVVPAYVCAQNVYPSVDPQASYITTTGDEISEATEGQNAPLIGHFTANPSDLDGWTMRYEWKIYRPGEEADPIVHRFEEDVDYTFTQSGTFNVQLYATFTHGNDTIVFPEEGEANPFVVNINESKLEFYNAISPNDDGFNDELKAKDGYQSIVSFEAAVFTRWGQKIYSWNDVGGKWDGKWNGHVVNDGVYFLVVKAKGADGKKYNIRKAINVLTGNNNNRENEGGNE